MTHKTSAFSPVISYDVAEGGQLHVLKWLWKHNCPWDESVGCAAAGQGLLDIIQWLYTVKIPMGYVTM